MADGVKDGTKARKEPADGATGTGALQLGELSELLGYSLKRAQLKVFEDFLRCVAPLQLTPAQFSVLVEAMDWRRTIAPPPVPQPVLV